MHTKPIILLLSNHRNSDRPELPDTLSKTQIASLIESSLSPNIDRHNITHNIAENLRELAAQGEINSGSRNRYCIAPPTVLAASENNLARLLFKGDRAYLALAHKILNTTQKPTEIKIKNRINNFEVIRNKLSQVGIAILTIDRSIESLPLPRIADKSRSAISFCTRL